MSEVIQGPMIFLKQNLNWPKGPHNIMVTVVSTGRGGGRDNELQKKKKIFINFSLDE